MYKDFFGLKRSPFELSPDPYFVLPTAKIKDTLFSIYYAIAQRKGFVVLTGEVGTGKTLMIRCLLTLLKRQQVRFCNVFNPRLSPLDFLRFVVHDLGIDVAEPTKANLLQALYRFLLAQAEKGLTTVLVIDEAQQLPLSVLEEVLTYEPGDHTTKAAPDHIGRPTRARRDAGFVRAPAVEAARGDPLPAATSVRKGRGCLHSAPSCIGGREWTSRDIPLRNNLSHFSVLLWHATDHKQPLRPRTARCLCTPQQGRIG